MTQLLFESARLSLLQIMADPRRLGVLPGVLMTLHTWGRNLSHHPHLHCLVSAGGLDASGSWQHCRSHIPVSALPLKRLFRGKFLGLLGALLTHKRLHLPPEQDHSYWRSVIRQLYRKDFNVQVCDVYPHGRGVALYLARYVKGGPLPKERALHCNGQRVSFEFTDHRDQRRKTQTLPVQQFIDRILWHAPPKGQHLTRYAGLYTTPARERYHQAEQALQLRTPTLWPRTPAATNDPAPLPPEPPRCPHCGHFLLRLLHPRTHHFGEFSHTAPSRPHEAAPIHARAPPRRCPTPRSS
jgi:hypothetical protein